MENKKFNKAIKNAIRIMLKRIEDNKETVDFQDYEDWQGFMFEGTDYDVQLATSEKNAVVFVYAVYDGMTVIESATRVFVGTHKELEEFIK